MEATNETTTPATALAPTPGLLARFWTCLMSPRKGLTQVAAHPTWLGMLGLVLVVGVVLSAWFMSTQVGRQIAFDESMRMVENFLPRGQQLPQEQVDRMKETMGIGQPGIPWRMVIQTAVGGFVATPVILLLLAGIGFAVFAIGGSQVSFKTLFSTVVHAVGPVWTVQSLFLTPVNYFSEQIVRTNLSLFVPMLDETGFVARLLGSIDLFRVWWILLLAMAFGVTYRKKTTPIALAFFGVYLVIALAFAAIMAARS